MSNNPVNLGLRFILEVVGLLGYFRWGRYVLDGNWVFFLGLFIALIAAMTWAIFRVEGDDPYRERPVPVNVPGTVRLGIEAVYFILSVIAFMVMGETTIGVVFALVLIGHYAVSYDRIGRLLRVDKS